MFPNGIINRLMDFNLVSTMQSKNCLCYVITSLIKPLHRFAEHLMLLWGGIKLYHQSLKHSIEGYLQGIYGYRTPLLPGLKARVSGAEVRR